MMADPTRGARFQECDQLLALCPSMKLVRKLIETISLHDCPVLISGESGTGKELVARSIHLSSRHRSQKFVPVDCATLTPSLIEAELFGYEKGAFTGASGTKVGLFEEAGEGTLFLDEVGELPVGLQAKLLRALQEHEIRRVGGVKEIQAKARFVAATNRDLEAALHDHTFRQDLYYRLNVVRIKLLPLRERPCDIVSLTHHFLSKYSVSEPQECRFSEAAMHQLLHYDWPGNVRELENVVQRALAMSCSGTLEIHDLALDLRLPAANSVSESDPVSTLDVLERRAILQAVQQAHGDKIIAAALLGIGRTTLYRRLKEYRGAA